MTTNISAGTGVHAYYRYHSHFRVRPSQLTDKEVKALLDRLPDRKNLPVITPKLLRDIRHCWQFLDDFRRAADTCQFEVQFGTPATLTAGPDILAEHGADLFVVETKVIHTLMENRANELNRIRQGLFPADAVFHKHSREQISPHVPVKAAHGQKQVKAGISHLKQKTKHTKAIYGFVLVFLFFPDNLPWPVWKPVSQFIPSSPSA